MADKARQLDQDIARLTRMRDSLSHAAGCTNTPLIDCPEFKSRIRDGEPRTADGAPLSPRAGIGTTGRARARRSPPIPPLAIEA